MRTVGIHPKVARPALAGVAAGIVLFVAGVLTHDGDLKTAGVSVFLAALGYGGIGYAAPAAPVSEPNVGPANDDLLAEHQKK